MESFNLTTSKTEGTILFTRTTFVSFCRDFLGSSLTEEALGKTYSSFARAYPYLQIEFANNPRLYAIFVDYMWRMSEDKSVYNNYKPSKNDTWYSLFSATADRVLIDHVRSLDIEQRISREVTRKYVDANPVEAFLISTIVNNPLVDFADWMVGATKVVVKYQVNSIVGAVETVTDKLSDVFGLDKVEDYSPITPPAGVSDTPIKEINPQYPPLVPGNELEVIRGLAPGQDDSRASNRDYTDDSLDEIIDNISVNEAVIPKGNSEKRTSKMEQMPTRQSGSSQSLSRSNPDVDDAFNALPGLN